MVLALAFAAYVIPRQMIGGGSLHPVFYPPSASYFVQTYLAWGVLWIPMLAGLVLCGQEDFPTIGLAFALLTAGAIFSSLTAYDTIRMWAVLLPVGLACWTSFFTQLRKRSPALMGFLWLLALCNLPLSLPTILLPGSSQGMAQWEDFYFRYKVAVGLLHLTGFAINISALVVLGKDISAGLRSKLSRTCDVRWTCRKNTIRRT